MSKWLVVVLLVVIAGNAKAEWVKIESADPSSTLYIGLDTITRIRDISTAWVMIDINKEDVSSKKQDYKSQHVQYIFNCERGQMGLLFAVSYSGNAAKGSITHSGSPEFEWERVHVGTGGELLFNIVCRGRMNHERRD